MNTLRYCQQCGAELPSGEAQGLCPRCLLTLGLGSRPEPAGTAENTARGMPRIGEIFGRYRVVRALGRGGMGVVYEAEEQETGRRVALKVLGQQLDSAADRARFLREGRLAASINHPNCVYVYGTEEIEGTPTIAMELVPGGTLQERVRNSGPLSVSGAVDAILQIIAGLEAAHAIGILHRDVKPGNCFEDTDGTIKIGDFGLSIATAARADVNLTATGTMVGTPAFCSPEQLRGEELNVRSDLYAVGVTLFFLLCGRVPFAGDTMPQLISNVLEKPAPSVRRFRPEVPSGLARVIARCLQKQPAERYRNYGELRQALAAYSSLAATPATLRLRFVAGLFDFLVLSLVSGGVVILLFNDPAGLASLPAARSPWTLSVMLSAVVMMLLYYGVSEGTWGATPGKALCRLRVVRLDNNPPGMAACLVRATIYVILPTLPVWLITRGDPLRLMGESGFLQVCLNSSYYVVLAVLFSTVRRRNGFAAIHDLLTRTRVVSRQAPAARPLIASDDARPPALDNMAQIGPYHVLERIGEVDDTTWLLAYDMKLLRKVWLRMVPPGIEPLPAAARNVGRPGRLRWLTGRRSPVENWDAFEGATGQALLGLARAPQSWAQVRFWLSDLAAEISAAEQDGTLPSALSLDRVWITADGRAKLLDFAAPGVHLAGMPEEQFHRPWSMAPGFLSAVAAVALTGSASRSQEQSYAGARLPLHAREFLTGLPGLADARAAVLALKPLLSRVATVTRRRRAAIVAGCLIFPVISGVMVLVGMRAMERWRQTNPELIELSTLLQHHRFVHSPDDRTYSVFIASHYASVITNNTVWTSPVALALIKGKARHFAEASLNLEPAPAPDEIARADQVLKRRITNQQPFAPSSAGSVTAIFLAITLIYVAFPAVLAAAAFRGGFILRVANTVFVRRDGSRASRLRMLWRAVVAWSPVGFGLMLYGLASALRTDSGVLLLLLVPALPALVSVLLPARGLADRLAGTWPVPR